MNLTSLSIRRAAMLLLMAVVVVPNAMAAQEREEVKDRQGNVIRVVDGDGQRDVEPAAATALGIFTLPEDAPALRDSVTPPSVLPPVGGSDSWPMFQANARHTGFLDIDLDPGRFAVLWQRGIGGGRRLNPVAAGGGKVFVSLDIWFNDIDSFFALDAVDGHTLWAKNFGPVSSVNPPSYAYGMAYVQTGKSTQGIPPWFRGLDGETGTVVFQAPFTAQWENYFAPTIHDGKAYVNGGTYGGMYAFDAFNGSQLWFNNTLPQYDQWTPAVDDTRAYAYLGGQAGLYSLNRATGGTSGFAPDPGFQWNGYDMNLAPVLTDPGDLLAIQGGRLMSFIPSTNTKRFELGSSAGGPYTGQPSYHAGRIYAVKSGRLVVLDETTGAEIWAWTPPLAGQIVGPMIVTRTHVLACTSTKVYAVDVATHQDVWSFPISGHLAIADDTLYVASSDGMLTAFTTFAQPALSISDRSVTEGDWGFTAANFTVTLSSPSTDTVTVDWATVPGTATGRADYRPQTGTLSFAPGETRKLLTVRVWADLDHELTETYAVVLTNALDARIVDGSGTGTILDNDGPPALSIGDVTVTEGDTGFVRANLTISLTAASYQTVSVDWANVPGTATPASDYLAQSGAVTFAPGQTKRVISVRVWGDLAVEGQEQFGVNLNNPVNASLADGTATATIDDNE